MADWRERLMRGAEVIGRVERRTAPALNNFPGTRTHKRILFALNGSPGITDRVLGEILGMMSAQLSRNMPQIFEAGWVKDEPYLHHARQRKLTLTDAGQALVDEMRPARLAAFDDAMASLTPRDRSLLVALGEQKAAQEELSFSTSTRQATVDDVITFNSVLEKFAPSNAAGRREYLARLARAHAARLSRWLGDDLGGWVEVDDHGRHVGFCMLTPGSTVNDATSDEGAMMMAGPLVIATHRHREIGTRLLQRCITTASHWTYASLSTHVSTNDKRLTSMLRKNGFKRAPETDEHNPFGGTKDIWTTYSRTFNPEIPLLDA